MTKFPIDGTGRLASERDHPTAALPTSVENGSQIALGNIGSSATVDLLSAANSQVTVTGTLTADTVISIVNRAAGCRVRFVLTQDSIGSHLLRIYDGTVSSVVPFTWYPNEFGAIEAWCPNSTDIYISSLSPNQIDGIGRSFPLGAYFSMSATSGPDITTPPIDTFTSYGVSPGSGRLVIAVAWLGNHTPAVTDSLANTWTLLKSQLSADTSIGVALFYSTASVKCGHAHTFSTNFGLSAFPALAVLAFDGSGVADGLPNLSLGATSTTATVLPGSGTINQWEMAVSAAACNAPGDIYDNDSGFVYTALSAPVSGGAPGLAVAFRWAVSPAQVANPTWKGSAGAVGGKPRVAVMGSWASF